MLYIYISFVEEWFNYFDSKASLIILSLDDVTIILVCFILCKYKGSMFSCWGSIVCHRSPCEDP